MPDVEVITFSIFWMFSGAPQEAVALSFKRLYKGSVGMPKMEE